MLKKFFLTKKLLSLHLYILLCFVFSKCLLPQGFCNDAFFWIQTFGRSCQAGIKCCNFLIEVQDTWMLKFLWLQKVSWCLKTLLSFSLCEMYHEKEKVFRRENVKPFIILKAKTKRVIMIPSDDKTIKG